MAANLDWNFGWLPAAIDEAGIWSNTIVVFTADHGEMMGAQGRRAKNILYEEAVRVPFLLRWLDQRPHHHPRPVSAVIGALAFCRLKAQERWRRPRPGSVINGLSRQHAGARPVLGKVSPGGGFHYRG